MSGAASGALPLSFDRVSYEVRGRRLVSDLTLDLEAGPRTVILGPNGAGKSVTLRLAHGLLKPTRGRVLCAGRPADAAQRRRQAMVFQNAILLRRSVVANVGYALGVRGVRRGERRDRSARALDQAGLAQLAARPARAR